MPVQLPLIVSVVSMSPEKKPEPLAKTVIKPSLTKGPFSGEVTADFQIEISVE